MLYLINYSFITHFTGIDKPGGVEFFVSLLSVSTGTLDFLQKKCGMTCGFRPF